MTADLRADGSSFSPQPDRLATQVRAALDTQRRATGSTRTVRPWALLFSSFSRPDPLNYSTSHRIGMTKLTEWAWVDSLRVCEGTQPCRGACVASHSVAAGASLGELCQRRCVRSPVSVCGPASVLSGRLSGGARRPLAVSGAPLAAGRPQPAATGLLGAAASAAAAATLQQVSGRAATRAGAEERRAPFGTTNWWMLGWW